MVIPKIMTHFISHFPDEDTSHDIALALAQSGAAYLEIQFPFSDPSADGIVIQAACTQALLGHTDTVEKKTKVFSTQRGFALIKRICRSLEEQTLKTPIFLMTYANIVFAKGVENFVKQTRACGAKALIIPDLPFDSDIGVDLIKACKTHNIQYIPVVVITTAQKRLKNIIETVRPQYMYISLRIGTTGSSTEITDEIKTFLSQDVFAHIKIFGGFGIQNAKQISLLQNYVHASVVGSAIIRVIQNTKDKTKIVAQVSRVCKDLLL